MSRSDSATLNGQKALKNVAKVLTSIGWEPEETEIAGVLRVDFTGDKIPIAEATADVRIDFERFLYYLNFGERVPLSRLGQVMEFVTRANFDLISGNFELSLEDGALRFKSSIDFTGVNLNETLIRNMIRSSMDAVELYGDAVVKVIRGERSAEDAIDEVESDIDTCDT